MTNIRNMTRLVHPTELYAHMSLTPSKPLYILSLLSILPVLFFKIIYLELYKLFTS
jgi:hypothetical protein